MATWAGVTLETAKAVKLPADMMQWFQAAGYDDFTDVAMATRIGLAGRVDDSSSERHLTPGLITRMGGGSR